MHALIVASIAMALLMTTPSVGAAQNDADARLAAIYTTEWTWREQQLPDEEDSQKPIQDHLPKVDPAAQQMRLHYWEDVLRKLEAIDPAQLSAKERLNYAVYRPQIEGLIANQRFRDYEMPVNSDTTFWTNLGYTARRIFRKREDYKNWLAQLHDLPRYFNEQMDEMRAGAARGFTPPAVTMRGRDASITVVTQASPENATPTCDLVGLAELYEVASFK